MRKKRPNNIESRHLIVVDNPTSVISEQFRTVRTNVQFSMIDTELKSLLITSPEPASGKTTIAANLAAAYANEDFRVLLVDADMRKPVVHHMFNSPNTRGLTTILTQDDLRLEDVIYMTDVDGLFVMTSGVIPPNPAELLGSRRMKELIQEMEDYFDLLIFDTPPILAVTDAQVLSSLVDGTIIVVPKGEATKDQLEKTDELLKNVNANILGFVFNRVEKSSDSYYYYYGSE